MSDQSAGPGVPRNQEPEIALQEVIDRLAQTGRGRPVADLLADLREEIARRDLPKPPFPFLEAVATGAAAGNPYVLSPWTAHQTHVPPPQSRTDVYDIT